MCRHCRMNGGAVLCRAREIQPGLEIPVLAAQSLLVDEQLVHLIYDLDEATGQRRSVDRDRARFVLHRSRERSRATCPARHENICARTWERPDAPAVGREPHGPPALDPVAAVRTFGSSHGPLIDLYRSPEVPLRISALSSTGSHAQIVLAEKNVLVERADVLKKAGEPLWPNKTSLDRGYELSWFASTNRYFALAIHPVLDELQKGSRSLTSVVERIGHRSTGEKAADALIFTQLYSPLTTVGATASTSFDMGVFAGPMNPKLLDNQEPYNALNMGDLVLYQMSSCCAICTFQWLAHLLILFLSLVHTLLGDWGIAIVLLVCVVRTMLHPLTKRAQINMHRFSSTMGDLKPELEKLQQKYKDDPKRFQSEQLKLMREKGLNPLQFLGCLPMFLQTPIWIALYAMLYFAYEISAATGVLRHLSEDLWRPTGPSSRTCPAPIASSRSLIPLSSSASVSSSTTARSICCRCLWAFSSTSSRST